MRETFTCPACGNGEVEAEIRVIPGEKRTHDYPGSPTYVEAEPQDTCSEGCCLSVREMDLVTEEAKDYGYHEYSIARPAESPRAAA